MLTPCDLTPKQYEEFAALFRLFDADSNGVLCGTEIDDALSVLEVGLSEVDRQRLLVAAQATGSIGREAFIDWLSTREDFDLTREYRAVFDLADSDGDGSLSSEEMLQLARCLDPACNEIALEVLIFEHDADGDDRIGFEEFMRMQQANIALQLTIAGVRRFKKMIARYRLAARNTRIALVEVDSDLGAGKAGAHGGVEMLRQSAAKRQIASRGVDTLGRQQGRDSLTPHARNIESIRQLLEETCALVSGTLKEGAFPVVLGGDHSTAAGTIAGICDAYPDKRLGVVWIDAHADVHSPYTTPSGNMHGMPLALASHHDNRANAMNTLDAVTHGHWEACKALGRPHGPNIDLRDVVYVSVRDTEPAEDATIAQFGIPIFSTADVRSKGPEAVAQACLDYLGEVDMLYISFDVDSMDAAICMGTGTPVPGGLSADEASRLNRRLVSDPRVVCWEICEINPELDLRNSTGQVSMMVYEETLDALQSRLSTAMTVQQQGH
jgi:arginase